MMVICTVMMMPMMVVKVVFLMGDGDCNGASSYLGVQPMRFLMS